MFFLCICTPFKILIKYFHNITRSDPVLCHRQPILTNAFNEFFYTEMLLLLFSFLPLSTLFPR